MSRLTLLLIRHAEAYKNVEDRHGGSGTSLTERGLRQCDALIQRIQQMFGPLSQCTLIGHRVPQVEETVERIGRALGVLPIWDERLRGINLGVVAGLSRIEAAAQWPDVHERLELWRKGQLKIHELRLPGGEVLDDFRDRVEEMLFEWLTAHKAELLIVVGTTSALIMLVNLIRLGNDFNYDAYKVYDFASASITQIEFDDGVVQLVSINDIGHLDV